MNARIARFLVASAAASLVITAEAGAASSEVHVQVALVVPVTQSLESEADVIRGPLVTSQDLARGFVDLDRPILLRLSSNVPWELCVRVPDPPARNREDPLLFWSVAGNGHSCLQREWVEIASGAEGCAGFRIPLRLRVPLSWTTVKPGEYEPRIEYRLAPRAD